MEKLRLDAFTKAALHENKLRSIFGGAENYSTLDLGGGDEFYWDIIDEHQRTRFLDSDPNDEMYWDDAENDSGNPSGE